MVSCFIGSLPRWLFSTEVLKFWGANLELWKSGVLVYTKPGPFGGPVLKAVGSSCSPHYAEEMLEPNQHYAYHIRFT